MIKKEIYSYILKHEKQSLLFFNHRYTHRIQENPRANYTIPRFRENNPAGPSSPHIFLKIIQSIQQRPAIKIASSSLSLGFRYERPLGRDIFLLLPPSSPKKQKSFSTRAKKTELLLLLGRSRESQCCCSLHLTKILLDIPGAEVDGSGPPLAELYILPSSSSGVFSYLSLPLVLRVYRLCEAAIQTNYNGGHCLKNTLLRLCVYGNNKGA